jgi:UDP-N-acetylenolpyruvoylglucosamine reductase
MKKIAILTALVISILQGYSQTADDALRYSQDFYNGSARNMSMGSAFSTPGADFSAASINPAGLGLYRGDEMSITPQLNFVTANRNITVGTEVTINRFFP